VRRRVGVNSWARYAVAAQIGKLRSACTVLAGARVFPPSMTHPIQPQQLHGNSALACLHYIEARVAIVVQQAGRRTTCHSIQFTRTARVTAYTNPAATVHFDEQVPWTVCLVRSYLSLAPPQSHVSWDVRSCCSVCAPPSRLSVPSLALGSCGCIDSNLNLGLLFDRPAARRELKWVMRTFRRRQRK